MIKLISSTHIHIITSHKCSCLNKINLICSTVFKQKPKCVDTDLFFCLCTIIIIICISLSFSWICFISRTWTLCLIWTEHGSVLSVSPGMSCVKDGPWSPEHTSDFSQRLCVCVCVCVVSSGLLFKALWLDETPDHIKLQIMLSWICSGLHILTYLWRMIDRSGFISPETAS